MTIPPVLLCLNLAEVKATPHDGMVAISVLQIGKMPRDVDQIVVTEAAKTHYLFNKALRTLEMQARVTKRRAEHGDHYEFDRRYFCKCLVPTA